MKPTPIPLAQAKAKLSEIIRNVRKNKNSVLLTVDGIPAAEIRPIHVDLPASLSEEETLMVESLTLALKNFNGIKDKETWNAVESVKEGRR